MRSSWASLAMFTFTGTALVMEPVEGFIAKRNQLLACVGETEGKVSTVGQILCALFGPQGVIWLTFISNVSVIHVFPILKVKNMSRRVDHPASIYIA